MVPQPPIAVGCTLTYRCYILINPTYKKSIVPQLSNLCQKLIISSPLTPQVPVGGSGLADRADGEDERAADLLQRAPRRGQRGAAAPRRRPGPLEAANSVSEERTAR